MTISAVDRNSGERSVYTLKSIDHEAEQDIDAHEAEYGADGTRAFRDAEEEEPSSSFQEKYVRYKPVVIAAVAEDAAYRNACGHSDRENAVIEGNAAIRRVILASGDLELIRLYSDVPEFRDRLHQDVIDETYSRLHELLRPLSQEDIDDAIRAWNGNMDSKRRVVRYMQEHARDRDTAAWLASEYGDNPLVVRAGNPEQTELPWPKAQRRIAQLIQDDRFFTEQEQDNFENIDADAIREQLESGEPNPFVERVIAEVERAAEEDIAEEPQSEDAVGSFVYNGVHFEPVGVLGESFDANDTVRHTVSHNELGMSAC